MTTKKVIELRFFGYLSIEEPEKFVGTDILFYFSGERGRHKRGNSNQLCVEEKFAKKRVNECWAKRESGEGVGK